jgi:DNA-binding NtrC family response regulator
MTLIPPPVQGSVLLIDDDDMIAGSLRQYLVLRGCEVDTAQDFIAAEKLMIGRSYGVIVVDPYLTGGVQRENRAPIDDICRLQPHAAVIVLTGYDSPKLARIAADCHVTALLTKPQSILTLSRVIAEGSSHAQRSAAPITPPT